MENKKQTNKKQKKKKKNIEEIEKKEELGLKEQQGKLEESFTLVSQAFKGILTTQQLSNLEEIHRRYIEVKETVDKTRKSLEIQYGPTNLLTILHRKCLLREKLITGWNKRLVQQRAIKQKQQTEKTSKEIIAKFQKALAERKDKDKSAKGKNRKIRIQQEPSRSNEEKLRTWRWNNPNEQEIQKIMEKLKEESRPRIGNQGNIDVEEELGKDTWMFIREIGRKKASKGTEKEMQPYWKNLELRFKQGSGQKFKEAWKKRKRKNRTNEFRRQEEESSEKPEVGKNKNRQYEDKALKKKYWNIFTSQKKEKPEGKKNAQSWKRKKKWWKRKLLSKHQIRFKKMKKEESILDRKYWKTVKKKEFTEKIRKGKSKTYKEGKLWKYRRKRRKRKLVLEKFSFNIRNRIDSLLCNKLQKGKAVKDLALTASVGHGQCIVTNVKNNSLEIFFISRSPEGVLNG